MLNAPGRTLRRFLLLASIVLVLLGVLWVDGRIELVGLRGRRDGGDEEGTEIVGSESSLLATALQDSSPSIGPEQAQLKDHRRRSLIDLSSEKAISFTIFGRPRGFTGPARYNIQLPKSVTDSSDRLFVVEIYFYKVLSLASILGIGFRSQFVDVYVENVLTFEALEIVPNGGPANTMRIQTNATKIDDGTVSIRLESANHGNPPIAAVALFDVTDIVSTSSSPTANDYVAQIVGNGAGGSPQIVGYQTVTLSPGQLDPGFHTITVGAYNNKKTDSDEITLLRIDSIEIVSQNSKGLVPILETNFSSDEAGFVYEDDVFRGTSNGKYADGDYVADEGLNGDGALLVTLGGEDNSDVEDGMSGGWLRDFLLVETGDVTVKLTFQLEQSRGYEESEFSQALCSIDDVLVGEPSSITPQSRTQPDVIARINCGGEDFQDNIGNKWSRDAFFSGGATFDVESSTPISNTENDVLFVTERYSEDFEYDIEVEDEALFRVNLFFAEIFFSEAEARVFDVYAEGILVLDDLDLFQEAGAAFTAVEASFVISVTDGSLTLRFLATSSKAKVSAIEVLSPNFQREHED